MRQACLSDHVVFFLIRCLELQVTADICVAYRDMLRHVNYQADTSKRHY